ncbi:hypothetical protein MXB_1556 [Myxobolus squamalis]|nr:hypothetical protein MXB_1556 [Myxobolus squamalis]
MLLRVDLGALSRFKNFSGFGFVMFKTIEEADTVLKTRPHMLDGKIVARILNLMCKIDPKKAVGITKTGLPVTKKIFVGGVRSETSDDLLREYFSQFGTVHSLDFPIDHVTNKRRGLTQNCLNFIGFCFLEFDEPEAAERSMSMNFHPIGNQTVEVNPAYTKEQQQALMAKGMWPPQNGTKPGKMPLSFDSLASLDPDSQNALKAFLGQNTAGPSFGGTVSTSAGQMDQASAAALFYQTYLQYAMALSAASLVQNNTNVLPQPSNFDLNVQESSMDANPQQEKRISPSRPSHKSRIKSRSPRKSSREDRRRSSSDKYRRSRRRRRSSSEKYQRGRRRSGSPTRPSRRR